jgi:hypothetical protein
MPFKFVKQHNIQHFERLLSVETDPANRARIERLLAEERAKDDSDDFAGPHGANYDRPSG